MIRSAACVLCLFAALAVSAARVAVAGKACGDSGGQSAGAMKSCAGSPAASSQAQAAGPGALSEKARAKVDELHVKMRFLMSVGMQAKSREKRDEIAAIYAAHGVQLPDEYRDW